MSSFSLIAQTEDATALSEYTPKPRRSEAYESEAQTEAELISPVLGIAEKSRKTRIVQKKHTGIFGFNNKSIKNIKPINKVNIYSNFVQVINQYVAFENDNDAFSNSYNAPFLANVNRKQKLLAEIEKIIAEIGGEYA